MTFFFEILIGSPWWVYCLFAYVIVIGIKAMQEQVVSFPKVFLLPAGLTFWSLSTLVFSADLMASILWTLTYVLGIFFGWMKIRSILIIDVRENAMTIPGNRSTLIVLLSLFFAKYVLVVFQEIDGHIAFSWANTAVSALVSGFFFGRVFSLRRKYAKLLLKHIHRI